MTLTISGNASIVDGTSSSCLAPWLDTIMAEAPISKALIASKG